MSQHNVLLESETLSVYQIDHELGRSLAEARQLHIKIIADEIAGKTYAVFPVDVAHSMLRSLWREA